MDKLQIARETAKDLVRTFFKNDYGQPYEMTNGQADIFLLIYTRAFPRNEIIAPRQYGKSDAVAMALILRSETFNEQWAIVAGQKDKAMIIMNRVIQHTFDHERFYSKLEIDKNMPLEKLKRERSKENITWLGGGGVKVFTANTTNKNAVTSSLTGFGSPNIVADEASLVPDDVMAMILSMLGGHVDNFLLKIGNPFFRNHFFKTWNSDRYHKILIDYKQALSEGRYSTDYIEEMRNLPFFDVLYECKFPESDQVMAGGYRKLISDELLESAFITTEEYKRDYCNPETGFPDGQARLGGDFAGGGNDRSAYVVRWPKVMLLIETNKIADTMQQVPIIENHSGAYGIEDHDIALDKGNLGQGVVDRLHERDRDVVGVLFGERASDPTLYINKRAEIYYQLFNWLRNGGKIVRDDSFYELLVINYKENSEKRFQIQPKEELKKMLKAMGLEVTSPDVADAAALTFADNTDLVTEDDFDVI